MSFQCLSNVFPAINESYWLTWYSASAATTCFTMQVQNVATQDYQDYELKSFLDMLEEPSKLEFDYDPLLLANIWDEEQQEVQQEESMSEVVWREFKAWNDLHINLPVQETCKARIRDGCVVNVRMYKPFARPLTSEELPDFREFLNKIF